VRRGAFIGKGAVLMPSFVNIGAYVGENTMVDTWATIGSCAQIGRNVHISGGTGIGGVLEPLQAGPVVIEDDCFIGARSEVAEGVIVEQGAVLSMGVFLGASTKIVDRATGEVTRGRVPAYSVVVPARCRTPMAAPASPAPSSSSASTRKPDPRPASTNCCGISGCCPAIRLLPGEGGGPVRSNMRAAARKRRSRRCWAPPFAGERCGGHGDAFLLVLTMF
jgi:acetyltransferase-like isoleucine patch superfamily enzyme